MPFQKGNKIGGKHKGSIHRLTKLVNSILDVIDDDPDFLRNLKEKELGKFCDLVGKILPRRMDGQLDINQEVKKVPFFIHRKE
jgi:hypothetical protein